MVEFTILRFIWSGKHFYPVVESFSCNFDSRDKVYFIFMWGYVLNMLTLLHGSSYLNYVGVA